MDLSLDGFVAAPDGDSGSWVLPTFDDELTAHVVALLEQADTHVIGRGAYEVMAPYWPTSDAVFAPPMNETPKLVVSTTLTDPAWVNTRVAPDIDEVARLAGNVLVHGGPALVRSLAERDLVDELHLIVHPVALGDGLRLFTERRDLKLVDSRAFPAGAVLNVYSV
jgi:dihydrofolate reductase